MKTLFIRSVLLIVLILVIDDPHDELVVAGFFFPSIPNLIVLLMNDDGMSPLIEKGSKLAASTRHPVEEGMIHAVLFNDGAYMIRRLSKDGKDYVLTPINPQYEEMRIRIDECLPVRIIAQEFLSN